MYNKLYVVNQEVPAMENISYTAIRKDLAKTMDRVCEDHTPLVITRQNAKPVVMLSLEDYESWEETMYLLRSPANAAALMESIAQDKAGQVTERDLIE
jgi:antitoxin YefM